MAESIANNHQKHPGVYNELLSEVLKPLNDHQFEHEKIFQEMGISEDNLFEVLGESFMP